MNHIDSKILYRPGDGMVVEAFTLADEEGDPKTDGEWASREDIEAFHRGEWRYVGVRVVVSFSGRVHLHDEYLDAELASDSLWGVVHGDLAGEVEVNAFEWTPSVREGAKTTAGSSLWGVTSAAVDSAAEVLAGASGREGEPHREGSPIWQLQRWAAPVDLAQVEAAHAEALEENGSRSIRTGM